MRVLALSIPLRRIKQALLKDIGVIIFDEFIINPRKAEKYLKGETKESKVIPLAHDLMYCDLGAATENILLAAHELGLGAVWCAVYPRKEHMKKIAKIIEAPIGHHPYAAIYIGYPSEDDKSKVKDKFDEKNIKIL